jgi:hypothetical protein
MLPQSIHGIHLQLPDGFRRVVGRLDVHVCPLAALLAGLSATLLTALLIALPDALTGGRRGRLIRSVSAGLHAAPRSLPGCEGAFSSRDIPARCGSSFRVVLQTGWAAFETVQARHAAEQVAAGVCLAWRIADLAGFGDQAVEVVKITQTSVQVFQFLIENWLFEFSRLTGLGVLTHSRGP